MIVLSLPKSFRVGDSIDYKFPHRSVATKITYRDQQTLVIDDPAIGDCSILIREAYVDDTIAEPAVFVVTLELPDPDLDISMPNTHLVGEKPNDAAGEEQRKTDAGVAGAGARG